MQSSKTKTIAAKVDESLNDYVQKEAKRTGQTKSAYVASALYAIQRMGGLGNIQSKKAA